MTSCKSIKLNILCGNQIVATAEYRDGAGASHPAWLADGQGEKCSVCAAISKVATDPSLGSMTAWDGLYTVVTAK